MRLNVRFPVMILCAHAGLLLAEVPSSTQPATDSPPVSADAPIDASTGASTGATDAAAEEAIPVPDRFRLDFTDLYVGFETEFQRQRVRTTVPGQKDSVHRNSDLRLIERTGLSLAGFAYDPGLLEYRAALEFGLTQGRFREESSYSGNWSDSESGFLTEFDINLDILKAKPVSFNVYARRADVRVPRRFLPSLREEQTELGASALAVGEKFTTEVGFTLRDVERFGNRLNEDDEELDVSRFYLDHRMTLSDNHKLRFLYEHEHDESNYQGSRYSFSTQRDEVRVEDEWLFGPDNKHRLDTYFRYTAEKGDLARDVLELVPRLSLQHNDKFRTIYRYGLYQYDQGGVKVTQNKVDAEAIWQATDKLTLTANGYGMHESIEQDVDTNQYGGTFDIAYHQPTSLGELSANVNVGFDQARSEGDAGGRFVRGEAQALGGSRPVFLRQRGVVPGSVVAYNANRTLLYVPNVDYTVTIIGGRALVDRTWTGRIVQDEVVYFDYAYILPAHGEVQSYRADLLIEHRFKFGLTPYYSLETRSQEVEYSVSTPWYRDNQDRHRIGTRYERDRWQVSGEYEIYDDSVLPYNAVHLTGRSAVLTGPVHNVDWSAILSRYCYDTDEDDRRVWWFETDLTGRSRILDWMWFKADTTYHFENDTDDGDTHGVDIEAGLEMQRGYLTFELIVEYDLLNLPRGDEQGVGIFFNVRRDLSHLLPVRKNR